MVFIEPTELGIGDCAGAYEYAAAREFGGHRNNRGRPPKFTHRRLILGSVVQSLAYSPTSTRVPGRAYSGTTSHSGIVYPVGAETAIFR